MSDDMETGEVMYEVNEVISDIVREVVREMVIDALMETPSEIGDELPQITTPQRDAAITMPKPTRELILVRAVEWRDGHWVLADHAAELLKYVFEVINTGEAREELAKSLSGL
jgi:hypothetical protein